MRSLRSACARAAARLPADLPDWVAGAALLWVAGCLLVTSARPIETNDFWWHAKLGAIFAAEGLDLEADPLTHTAPPGPPPRAQWLFGLGLHAVRRIGGFAALRAAHAGLVLAALALAYASLRAAGARRPAACAATAAFAVLGWYRFIQLRPDLLSIPATLLLYRLVLLPTLPSWPRVGATAVLVAVWAQMHSLYLLGPCLLVAGLAGAGLEALAAWRRPALRSPPVRRAGRLAAALALALLLSALHPEGPQAHLVFLRASATASIFGISDDWARLATLDPRVSSAAVSPLVSTLANATLALFAAATALRLRRGRGALRALDPVALALALAGALAMLAAVRFLWLGFFPLACLARSGPCEGARPARGRDAVAAAAGALLAASLAAGSGRDTATPLAGLGAGYWTPHYRAEKFYGEAVSFLAQTRLAGKLWNDYPIGGFLDYWLAPRLRTFVDGRLHVSKEVLRDGAAIAGRSGGLPGETYLDTLERRQVDVFLGVGTPPAAPVGERRPDRYTVAHLEGVREWIPVFRSLRSAVYLRANPRNRANLERVSRWYRRQRIPFDPERGVDAGAVARDHPEWAARRGMVWEGFGRLLQAARSSDPGERAAAQELLAIAFGRLGAHEDALAIDAELAARDPLAKAPRRRSVHALLRLGRLDDALAAASELVLIDREDPISREHLRLVRRAQALAAAPYRFPVAAATDRLPLPTLAP